MDSAEYHKQCSSPSSFHRKELEDTYEAMKKAQSEKAKTIANALASKPIEKPKQHSGGQENDYFYVAIPEHDAEIIIEELGTLEAQSVSPEGHTTALASHYASLLDRWLRFVGVG